MESGRDERDRRSGLASAWVWLGMGAKRKARRGEPFFFLSPYYQDTVRYISNICTFNRLSTYVNLVYRMAYNDGIQ